MKRWLKVIGKLLLLMVLLSIIEIVLRLILPSTIFGENTKELVNTATDFYFGYLVCCNFVKYGIIDIEIK
jgi:hypothetical protein